VSTGNENPLGNPWVHPLPSTPDPGSAVPRRADRDGSEEGDERTETNPVPASQSPAEASSSAS
jgi:hypothetical protein